jgi:hypothetical protein
MEPVQGTSDLVRIRHPHSPGAKAQHFFFAGARHGSSRALSKRSEFSLKESFPQPVKPALILQLCGTTEVVPFQNSYSFSGYLELYVGDSLRSRAGLEVRVVFLES